MQFFSPIVKMGLRNLGNLRLHPQIQSGMQSNLENLHPYCVQACPWMHSHPNVRE